MDETAVMGSQKWLYPASHILYINSNVHIIVLKNKKLTTVLDILGFLTSLYFSV